MIFIILLILGIAPFAEGDAIRLAPPNCISSSSYTANSTYQANLELISSTLPINASSTPSLFAKGSVGHAPDTAYGLALCRGDANASVCNSCLIAAFQDAQNVCKLQKDTTVYYESCLLRFSDEDFLRPSNASGDDSFQFIMWNTEDITEPLLPGWDPNNSYRIAAITGVVTQLLQQTADQSARNSSKRYATSMVEVSSTLPTLYSLAQCTPDLTPTECSECLKYISQQMMSQFGGQKGGRYVIVRCNIRYEVYQFYQGESKEHITSPPIAAPPMPPAVPPTPALPSFKPNRRTRKVLVIALVVPLVALFFCAVTFVGLRRHGKDKGSKDGALVWELEGRNSEFTVYDFLQILEATDNFSDENKLGQGGFGSVYKGRFPGGLEVAIKRLASYSGQGLIEFKNEIQLIAKLQHTNLVRLLGCCTQGEEKILIYEYLPNKSLDFFIFDETRRALLDWNKRQTIIEGIAQGLLYLHKHSRLRVIHRDIKPSNILLDDEMNPKISDFGLAKIFSKNDIEGSTQRIAGTYGYIAPEYASKGLFSIKSDVFSFGVLTLEIVNGNRASSSHGYGDFINLPSYAWQLWKDGLWLQLLDATLATDPHTLEMMRYINIALLCVQENAADRPTMSDVVAMLNSESMTLPEPKHPAYFHIRVTQDDASMVDESSVVTESVQRR
ncbi:unnamed protein product [Urochloa humidicola]